MSVSKKKLRNGPCLIIFTDLDGTLLDSMYSFRKALPALRMLKEKDITLVLCSSKTRAEIDDCRKKLGNEHPFISENGGGIFIPEKYFTFQISHFKLHIKEEKNYIQIKLGASYKDLRNALVELRTEGFDVQGFGDMTVKKVAELTGLNIKDAKMARNRDFDEPFVFRGDKTSEKKLKKRIKAKGFNYTQGEFFHIMGDSDKGRAVEILKELYKKRNRNIVTIGVGDSPNDIEMLQSVNHPVIVKKKDGSFDRRIRVRNLIKADGIGPDGWNRAVIKLINTLNP